MNCSMLLLPIGLFNLTLISQPICKGEKLAKIRWLFCLFSSIWIYIYICKSYVCLRPLSVSPAVLRGKNFNIAYYGSTFLLTFFILALLICTIDLRHFIPFTVILTLAEGHKLNRKHTFQLIRMKLGLVLI